MQSANRIPVVLALLSCALVTSAGADLFRYWALTAWGLALLLLIAGAILAFRNSRRP